MKITWEKYTTPIDSFEKEQKEAESSFDNGDDELKKIRADFRDYRETAKYYRDGFATPHGFVAFKPSHGLDVAYNFWFGYTDAPLTNSMVLRISKTPGVEDYHFITKYRFRIAIAKKSFQEDEVKKAVEKAVNYKGDAHAEFLSNLTRNLGVGAYIIMKKGGRYDIVTFAGVKEAKDYLAILFKMPEKYEVLLSWEHKPKNGNSPL